MRGRWCVITSIGLSDCVFGPFDTYEEAAQWIKNKSINTSREINYEITVLFTKEGD